MTTTILSHNGTTNEQPDNSGTTQPRTDADTTNSPVTRIVLEFTPAGETRLPEAELPAATLNGEPHDESDPGRLSIKLRARGDDLTPAESAILDTAQTIRAKFSTGQPVPLKALQRVAVRFDPRCRTNVDFKTAVASLVTRGLCKRDSGAVTQFRLLRHLDDQHDTAETRFAALGVTPAQEQLLLCCVHCCSLGFDDGSPATRCAVTWLMMERHNMKRRQVKRVIRKLRRAGILEQPNDGGSAVLRLTPAAQLVVNKECDSLDAARQVTATGTGRSQTRRRTRGNTLTANEAQNGLRKFLRFFSELLGRRAA